MSDSLPLPPPDLTMRVAGWSTRTPFEDYLQEGARLRHLIDHLLPDDWDWDGKSVLDFGCGSAKVLRHFAAEAEHATFWGCDIHRPTIEWAARTLSPPFRFFANDLLPPLALPSASMDLVLATSVFTHIADQWAAWLKEVHRLLAPGGIFIASFLGEGMWDYLLNEPYPGDEVAMAVAKYWEGPDAHVFHSEWWLREHWGRGFEFLRVERPPTMPDGSPQVTHSFVALRRQDAQVSEEAFTRIDPQELREIAGLETALRLARADIAELAKRRDPGIVRRYANRFYYASVLLRGALRDGHPDYEGIRRLLQELKEKLTFMGLRGSS